MYKLLLFILLIPVWMAMTALQLDEELAMHTLFQGKHALNRAVHAAAQQADPVKLAEGTHRIDPVQAQEAALQYLRANLRLDGANRPLPGTFLRSQVEVSVLEVINEDRTFPYTYVRSEYGYSVTLERPGVVMIIRLVYPRTYSVLGPIEWEIKAAAELIY